MADLKNNRRGGFYWLEDKPYISVTEILKVIDKPALRYWFGREVYRAMVVNPSLNEKEALSAPYQLSEEAKNRGSAVHSIVEAWKNINTVVGENGPYAGYARAFSSWLNDYNVVVLDSERTVVSDTWGYAGTLDILARVGGKTTIVDIKTGKDLYPEVHLQLSAYKEALSKDTEQTMAVLLNEDGTYKVEIGRDRLRAFLAAKFLYEDLNEDLLIKVGYGSIQRSLFDEISA